MSPAKKAEPVEDQAEPGPEPEGHISNWEFLDRAPTTSEVLALLGTLPKIHGLNMVDYADYVQALPQKKKVKVAHPNNPRLKIDESVENWVLYVSVAGRMAMLNAAAAINNWRVEIEPEPNSPVGAPGFISLEQRIVYREYIKIWAYMPNNGEKYLGIRNGMAWVPFSGGSQAAGSNPYEKVETSARGRALAAWGFGVLPGSGIASLEEIMGMDQNREAMGSERAVERAETGAPAHPNRPSREDLLEGAFTAVEALRQTTNDTEKGMVAKVGQYLSGRLGAHGVYDEGAGILHWDLVKDGHLVMLTNFLKQKNVEILGGLQ